MRMENELLRNGSGYTDPTAYTAMKQVDKEQREMTYKRGRIFEYEVKPGDFRAALIVSADFRASNDRLNIIILTDVWNGDDNVPVSGWYASAGGVSFARADLCGNYLGCAKPDEMKKLDAEIKKNLGLDSEEKQVAPPTMPVTPPNFAVELAEAKTEARIYRELYERLQGILAVGGRS